MPKGQGIEPASWQRINPISRSAVPAAPCSISPSQLASPPWSPRNRPPALRLELNAEATDYLRLPDAEPDAFSENWPVLRIMLADTCFKLTRAHILEEWSSDFPKPHPGTLARWLDRAVARGLIKRQGAGRKSDPFYYWLPECEGRLLGRREW